jgi:predicted HTH transcriptional regulator
MEKEELIILIDELRALPHESEWVEFKVNNTNPQEIGGYISALANSACIENKEYGYLIFGIENERHQAVGTAFKPRTEKIGNQELENWLVTQLEPKVGLRIFEFEYQSKNMVLFQIDRPPTAPYFSGAKHL